MLKPRALDHVGLKVTDMDKSLRFYCDGLGLKLLRRKDKEPGIASAVLAVGTQETNLFSNPDFSASPTGADPPGLDHFCLEVEAPRSTSCWPPSHGPVSPSPSRRWNPTTAYPCFSPTPTPVW